MWLNQKRQFAIISAFFISEEQMEQNRFHMNSKSTQMIMAPCQTTCISPRRPGKVSSDSGEIKLKQMGDHYCCQTFSR